MIGTKDAATALGLSEARIRQFVRQGRLPAMHVAGVLLFQEEDIERFADEPSRKPGRPNASQIADRIAKQQAGT